MSFWVFGGFGFCVLWVDWWVLVGLCNVCSGFVCLICASVRFNLACFRCGGVGLFDRLGWWIVLCYGVGCSGGVSVSGVGWWLGLLC